jgi:hypothetical protein
MVLIELKNQKPELFYITGTEQIKKLNPHHTMAIIIEFSAGRALQPGMWRSKPSVLIARAVKTINSSVSDLLWKTVVVRAQRLHICSYPVSD